MENPGYTHGHISTISSSIIHGESHSQSKEIDAFKHARYVPEESGDIEIFDGPWDPELFRYLEKHIPQGSLRQIEAGNHQTTPPIQTTQEAHGVHTDTPNSGIQRQTGEHDIVAVRCALSDAVKRVGKQRKLTYSVSTHAPNTFSELAAASTSRLVIYAGASEDTVWGEPSDNYLQRAWHDQIHLSLSAGTDWRGELQAALAQAAELGRLAGDRLASWVFGDLWGQTMHMVLYGLFPLMQSRFVETFISTGYVYPF